MNNEKNLNINETDIFKKGKLDIINWMLGNLKGEVSGFKNTNLGYVLRETKKDALYTLKMLIKCQIFEHLIQTLENTKKDLI